MFLGCDSFLEMLKTLAWCKQGEDVLVAIGKCTPEVMDAFRVHEIKVFPGGIPVKLANSWLTYLIEQDRDANPVPVLIVWKPAGVELWYRKNNSHEFPYDTWQDPAAAAYERERVFIPSDNLGATCEEIRQDLLGKVKACPSIIPPQ